MSLKILWQKYVVYGSFFLRIIYGSDVGDTNIYKDQNGTNIY